MPPQWHPDPISLLAEAAGIARLAEQALGEIETLVGLR